MRVLEIKTTDIGLSMEQLEKLKIINNADVVIQLPVEIPMVNTEYPIYTLRNLTEVDYESIREKINPTKVPISEEFIKSMNLHKFIDGRLYLGKHPNHSVNGLWNVIRFPDVSTLIAKIRYEKELYDLVALVEMQRKCCPISNMEDKNKSNNKKPWWKIWKQ